MIAIESLKRIFFGTQEKKTIARNTIWLSVAEMITRLSKFALIVYATRILGPTGFGQFSFSLAFVMIFAVFADLGLSQLITREIAQKENKEKDFSTVLSLKLLLSLLTFLILIIYSKFTIQNPAIESTILVLSVFAIAESIRDYYYAFFQAKQKMQYESWSKIIQSLLIITLGLILVYKIRSSYGLGISYALASISSLIYMILIYRVKTKTTVHHKLSYGILKKYFKMSWPLALTGIFVTIYSSIDSVMMGYYGQITQVGLYNASYRVAGVMLVPGWLLYRSFYPAINETYTRSKRKLHSVWKFYIKITLSLLLPILLVGTIFAPQIINIIFGIQYKEAVFSLRVLTVMTCVVILSYPFNQFLIAIHQQKKIFWATLWGAFINMVLNIFLIPKYSLNGAAIATLVAVIVVFLIQLYFSLRIQKERVDKYE